MFHVDTKEIENFRKFLKSGPRIFNRAGAGTLTAFAFGTRTNNIKVLERKTNIRNPKFIFGSLIVTKAKPGPIDRMRSITGSVYRPRYTGLAEQELGKPSKRNRVSTLASRAGDIKKPMRKWARLKPSRDFVTPKEKGTTRLSAFLAILAREKRTQEFILTRRYGKFKKGLYRFKRKKIIKLQEFGTKHTPRRIRWLTEGREQYFRTTNPGDEWAKSIDFQLKRARIPLKRRK
jgi:hypothetical protein